MQHMSSFMLHMNDIQQFSAAIVFRLDFCVFS